MLDWYLNFCKSCKKEYRQTEQFKISKRKNDKKYRNKNKDKRKEYDSIHREQIRLKQKERYDRKNEYIKLQRKEWYDKNRETINKKKREYYAKNKDTILQKMYKYKLENIDKVMLWKKKDYTNNKERYLYNSKVRKHKQRAVSDNTITRTALKELLVKQNYKCNYCWCNLDINIKYSVHIDHIIPISKWWLNSLSNIQYLCSKCNLSKWNNIYAQIIRKKIWNKFSYQ